MMKRIYIFTLVVIIILALTVIITIYLPENNRLYEFIYNMNSEIHLLRNETMSNFNHGFDNYLQFVPIVVLLVLKIGGAKGNLEWKGFWIFLFLSIVMTQTIVNIIKFSTVELRPDASDFLSFPSGHTATAFMSATILCLDYRKYNKIIILLGYLCAFIVAILRILNNRHWLFDVIIGAILGILLTYISYRIVIYFFKNKNNINQK